MMAKLNGCFFVKNDELFKKNEIFGIKSAIAFKKYLILNPSTTKRFLKPANVICCSRLEL